MQLLKELIVFTIFFVTYCSGNPPEKITPLNATAIVRGLPIRRFFHRWNPHGIKPYTEFVYTIITDDDKRLKLHCPYISLKKPCEEYSFKIIDGTHTESLCGKTKKYFYISKTNKLDIMLRTGKKELKVTPRCSAYAIKKT